MDRVGSAGRLLWSVPKKPAAGRKRRAIGCAIGCAEGGSRVLASEVV